MFFSGFSLTNESEIFDEYSIKNEVTVSAFSYGCIKLVENILNGTYESEHFKKRIDKIQLFSPAYFNDKDEKFKRMQLMFFKKDVKTYTDNFVKNCGFSEEEKNKYLKMGTFEELQELLYYKWSEEKMEMLKAKNIIIETYLGGDDKIINSQEALVFFRKFGEVYFIKGANHNLHK
ncbi:MAG: pimelyl-ACP methyl ester esterase BioV [Epsilonproteobacteria bacterium]|nr:pimelyl-ACP methyl ester esterase BioV [Campylobacterota bacterium]